jgi:tetratricopeptide (TPR) repeat protein
VQDALYASLLSGARGGAHEKTGLYLEARAGAKKPEIADLLAHHFTRTKKTDRAVQYLAMAADKSLRLFSLKETLSYLEQALKLIEKDPTCADDALVADLLVNRLMVCCWESDFANMVPLGQKYLARVERLGPSRQLSRVLAWMGEGYLNSERFEEAQQILNRALSVGKEIESDESIAYALWDIMWLHLLTPDGRSQKRYFELGDEILAAAKRLNDPYLETLTYYTLFADALQRGFLGEAQVWANHSIALGERTGYPPALSLGFMCASFAAAVAGNGSAGLELSQKAHDASAGATERLCALCASGLAQLTAGRPVESLATLQDFNRLAREAGFLAFLVVSEVPEAAARAFAGDPAGAIAALEASITRFTNWHNARIVAWAHLVLGQIYLAAASAEKPSGESSSSDQSGSLVKAEHHLVEAAATARTAAVKGFLLQALTTMADATLGPFKGAERAISLADARSIAVEIGAIPVVEHIDAIASNQGLAPAGSSQDVRT